MSNDQLVSVVIPAYNAEATLDETLHSVRAQTHGALEIIVVDDGSTDTTRALAEQHAAADARVQVFHQPNAGVAAARNAGWQHARSAFIAFVDADDLWAPSKIERQLQALQRAGPRAGLAYAWTARIDASGVVRHCNDGANHEGQVLPMILSSNFVCCGSNVLVRRDALIDAEGFDSRLRAAGAEGCEDWLFYSRVAETYDFVRVPEYLVGYRELHNSMSSNRQRMLSSHILMCRQMRARRPDQAGAVLDGLQNYAAWLLREVVSMRSLGQAWSLWRLVWNESRPVALRVLCTVFFLDPARMCSDRLRRSTGQIGSAPTLPQGRSFLNVPPL